MDNNVEQPNPVKKTNLGKAPSRFKFKIPKPETPEQAKKLKRMTYALVSTIVFIIVLSSISIIFNKGKGPDQTDVITPTEASAPEPTSESVKKPEWKTYSNLQYGFEFRYPSVLAVIPKEQTPPGFIPVCPSDNFVCITYPENPFPESNFEAAGFSMQVVPNIEDEIACATYSADEENKIKLDGTKLINGIKYYYGKSSAAATGHQIESIIYRTYHDNICFELEQNISKNSCDSDSAEGCQDNFSDENKTQLVSDLDQIILSLKFTGNQQSINRTPSSREKDGCVISGCSSEICSDKIKFSTCELKPEAECYKTATCEKQERGLCGWTQSEELTSCLSGDQ